MTTFLHPGMLQLLWLQCRGRRRRMLAQLCQPRRLILSALACLLAVVWLGDHPRLLGRSRFQQVVLDRAISDERHLAAYLAATVRAPVLRATIRKVDHVNDTTLVDVCFGRGRADPEPDQEPAAPVPVAGLVSR